MAGYDVGLRPGQRWGVEGAERVGADFDGGEGGDRGEETNDYVFKVGPIPSEASEPARAGGGQLSACCCMPHIRTALVCDETARCVAALRLN